MDKTSTKPYLIRAIFEWCNDNRYTPYLVVSVNEYTKVPMAYVKDGQITLDISYEATHALVLNNEAISFKARFGGRAQDVYVPIESVAAIYAQENGQGMGFEVTNPSPPSDKDATNQQETAKKPTLTLV